MRILMAITSVIAFYINKGVSQIKYGGKDELDFEAPLTNLIWIASLLSICVTFIVSYFQLNELGGNTWWIFATIISIGTLGAAVIPEITKVFTSPKSAHVLEVVKASHHGGASLNILSGFVTGNFSAFWTGLVFVILMFCGYAASIDISNDIMIYPAIFAFGLIAFGMLGMGPVTIAVDSYGPVTDNAQSVYELSLIEDMPDKDNVIEKEFGFKPDWEKANIILRPMTAQETHSRLLPNRC